MANRYNHVFVTPFSSGGFVIEFSVVVSGGLSSRSPLHPIITPKREMGPELWPTASLTSHPEPQPRRTYYRESHG